MPSPSKHQRGLGDSDADCGARPAKAIKSDLDTTSHLRNSTSPATFWDLPLELRSIVFDLACQRRYKQVDEAGALSNVKGRLRLDRKTIYCLSLVSRAFYATFNKVLYSHVKLVTPGELADFRQALVLKPSNGLLVKSVHVGPLSDLPKGWWPLRCTHDENAEPDDDPPIFSFKTSLTRRDATRPRWCKPEKRWCYDLPVRTCFGRAVDDAISVALEGVGVGLDDPEQTGYRFVDAKGTHIGINQWTVRIYEVQAVLDLYLGEMRRIEDEEKRLVPSWRAKDGRPGPKAPTQCRLAECGHYPLLRLNGFEGGKKEDGKRESAVTGTNGAEGSNGVGQTQSPAKEGGKRSTFWITREQVTRHLYRRGRRTDHFDHPLLVARTRHHKLSVDGKHRIVVVHGHHEDEQQYYSGFDSEDHDSSEEEMTRYNEDDFWERASSAAHSSSRSSSSSASTSSSREFDSEAFFPVERHDTVGLARSVLRLTSQARNLSLTGRLYSSIRTQQPELGMLRCLSLGPTSPPWKVPTAAMNMDMAPVEKLRVCGNGFGLWAAEAVGNLQRCWPALQEAQWDYGALHYGSQPDEAVDKLLKEFDFLHGRPPPHWRRHGDSAQTSDPADSATATSKEVSSNRHPTPPSSESRYIEVRLHPHHVAAMLKRASPAQREAWINGTSVSDAPHRIRLLESGAAKGSPEEDADSREQDFDVLRKGSMKWWEEEAWELERGELPNVAM